MSLKLQLPNHCFLYRNINLSSPTTPQPTSFPLEILGVLGCICLEIIMQLSSRSRALFVVVFIASLIYIYTWLLYPSLPLRKLLSVEVQQPVEPQQPLSKDDFISEATRIALGYYNSTPLENFCAHDSWDAHKVINCDRIFGGIGKVDHAHKPPTY